MRGSMRWGMVLILIGFVGGLNGEELPRMKFEEVREIVPGVFFRYSAISATDKSVVFGGSNNIWVVFEDYVVVIDANFPREAADVIAAVKKTTDKPIRYVFDTHHHGDHAYGNAVFAEAGASVVAQAHCARLMRVNGPREYAEAGSGPNGRKDVAASKLKVPNVVFDDKLVLDDGKQRIEFLYMGHGHTQGDAVAYLPKQKILCTGDACVNGAYNFMGHGDSASWIRALEKMQGLDVRMVCPGHGPVAGKDLLERQKQYFIQLRRAVKQGIEEHKDVAEIIKSFTPSWYKEWTGVEPSPDNTRHVFDEMTGRVAPWDLTAEFGIEEGPSPTKTSPGWTAPKRILLPAGLMPARLEELKRIAPDVEFVPARTAEEAARLAPDVDAVLGFCTAEIIAAGKKLRWIQPGNGDLDRSILETTSKNGPVLTSTHQVVGPQIADRAMTLLLQLAGGAESAQELHGKTVLIVGLRGVGTSIARRCWTLGMRVRAIEPEAMEKLDFLVSQDRPDQLKELLPQADVVIVAGLWTGQKQPLIGKEQIEGMKPGALLIHVGRSMLVDFQALKQSPGKLGGIGLDVRDPQSPGKSSLAGVVTLPEIGSGSPESRERQWRVYRENVRRFVAGEPLLCVVKIDKESAK